MNSLDSTFKEMIIKNSFPCVAAKDAVNKSNVEFFHGGHIACPQNDSEILNFLYNFIKNFRICKNGFHSAVVLFPLTNSIDENQFEEYIFQRLKALRTLDDQNFGYDKRVSSDPESENFSYSLMEEAFFIIGLHPNSSRPARQFKVPAIVFNPHVQFDDLRSKDRYQKMKNIVRKKDLEFSGSINPMLSDFGRKSEVYQYSGKFYHAEQKCPYS